MAGYIYIPVPTPEMLNFAREWQAGRQLKGKQPYAILRNYERGWRKGAKRKLGFGVLRNVTSADKVYILAHGSSQGPKDIGAERDVRLQNVNGEEKMVGNYKGYTPEQLANVIDSEGLPKDFIDLRVFACGSAKIPPDALIFSFAHALALLLRNRGFNQIRVTGYPGNVWTSYTNRQIAGKAGMYTEKPHKGITIDAEIYRAKAHKVVY